MSQISFSHMANIIAITFETLKEHGKIENKTFQFSPDDMAAGDHLNDPSKEFNQILRSFCQDVELKSGSTSISWDDGIRAALPIPIRAAQPQIASIGDLIHFIVQMSFTPEQLEDLSPNDDVMLQLASRAGRLTSNDRPALPH